MLHTSDWHLGRSFHQVGLAAAHAAFVDFLVDLVASERLDAVVVSGDVYDRALPAPDTVALLDEALTRLVDTGAQVVVSSGNHDSPARLGFGSRLLDRAGLHVRCAVGEVGRPILVEGVAVHAVPYLEPAVVAAELGVSERSHTAVLRAALDRVRADLADRPAGVVLAHAFVAGGVASDSERDISVGGVGVVPVEVFSGVTYAALGHLHRAQQVTPTVGYSGSPLALSFGEAGQVKSVAVVEVPTRGDRVPQVQTVPTPVPRRLAVLRGELADLLADRSLDWAEQAWCQVVLTDAVRPLGALDTVRRRFPHTLKLDFEPGSAVLPLTGPNRYAARTSARSPVEVCCDFLTHVRGGAGACDEERSLLTEAIEATRIARAATDDGAVAAAQAVVA